MLGVLGLIHTVKTPYVSSNLNNCERSVSKKGKVAHKQCRVLSPKSVSCVNQHFLKGSQFSEHTWDVMGMKILHSHTTVRGRYQTHVRQNATMVLHLERCAKLTENPVADSG